MYKSFLILFGLALIGIFIAGLSVAGGSSWMSWVDGVLGLISILNGVSAPPVQARNGTLAGSTISLSFLLFGTWIAAFFVPAMSWLTWTTFGFACAYFLVGISSGFSGRTRGRRSEPITGENPRKVA